MAELYILPVESNIAFALYYLKDKLRLLDVTLDGHVSFDFLTLYSRAIDRFARGQKLNPIPNPNNHIRKHHTHPQPVPTTLVPFPTHPTVSH